MEQTLKSKISCTVAILTFNSASTLKEALESVKNFAEVLICDGGSTDDTLGLARAFGAKVLIQDSGFKNSDNKIIDFAGVRNQTLHGATYPWFFYLDADELMTVDLEEEIQSLVVSGHPTSAFWVPRKYVIGSTVIECAATYPTKQMRFFHRDAVKGFIKSIHERIEVKTGVQIATLENFMLVPFNPDPAFHRAKWAHYVELETVRRGTISFFGWLMVCSENFKISALYTFRYFRNLLFCKGTRLPWKLEWERHMYHVNICRRFWQLLVGKKKS